MIKEQWRPIKDFEDLYLVSDYGRIKSLHRKQSKILKCGTNPDGYIIVHLCKDGQKKAKAVHSIVLEAFIGPCPLGNECCHNNNDPKDNRLVNLRWDTRASNCADKISNGTSHRGEGNPKAKLTTKKVLEIRHRRLHEKPTPTYKQLAYDYGVHPNNIQQIVTGKTWK